MPEVQMPRLSDTMEEGVLSRWLKAEGDQIHKGDVIAEIETDKAVMDLEAYDEGLLTALLVTEGTTVPIGQPIAIIGEDSVPKQTRAQTLEPDAGTVPALPSLNTPTVLAPKQSGAHLRATPLVRKIARERGIDLETLTGSGPGGRIVRVDIEHLAASPVAAKTQRSAHTSNTTSTPQVTTPAAGAIVDEEVALSTIRRITAERLTASAATPHFYLTSIADAERLLAFRSDLNADLSEAEPKVSVTDLLIRACAMALRTHRIVNSSWAKDKIVTHGHVNVGIAVATNAGLIVPVVSDADRKGIRMIAAETQSLTERARNGTLKPREFSGGTFTISNLGMYGVDHFTAIINPPEAAILAIGAATPTPVARDGEIVVHPIIKLTLSVDHRVVDGAPAADFLRDLIAIVEAPMRLVG